MRAWLADARLVRLRGETCPLLIPAPGARVEGVLVEDLGTADLDRIRFFESVEYEPRIYRVELFDGGYTEVQAFAPGARAEHDGAPWRFEDWLARHKATDFDETRLWMALHGYLDPAEADRRWDRARAEGRALEDLVAEIRAPAAADGDSIPAAGNPVPRGGDDVEYHNNTGAPHGATGERRGKDQG